jgi:hypothetical protein
MDLPIPGFLFIGLFVLYLCIKFPVMKKYLLPCIILFCGMVLLQSCKKPGHDTEYVTLNETVVAGSTYSLDLSAYGDGDDEPSITTQATDFLVSQINKDAVTAKNIYNFSASIKSVGKQIVVITLKEGHHRGGPFGGNCNRDEAVITINFTIQ